MRVGLVAGAALATSTLFITFSLGQKLSTNQTKVARNGLIAFSHRSQIYVVEPDGSGQRQLTSGEYLNAWPAWSSDGSKMAFVNEATHGISTMNPDGSDVQRLTDNRGTELSDRSPTWSPDGRIAFDRLDYANGTRLDVMIMNADGTNLVQLPHNPLSGLELAWSPDGRYFTSSGPKGIAVMRADGSNAKRVTVLNRFYDDVEPAWAPNNRWIVFTRLNRPPRGIELWTVRRNGTGLHRLREDYPLPDGNAAFSPDGKKIVFETYRRHRVELMTIRANGTHRTAFRTKVHGIDPAWQPRPSGPRGE